MNLSIVIPARNEEAVLDAGLAELKRVLDGRLQYEVIVVDNGSVDRTAEVAARHGARVCKAADVSIGAARNAGVALARCGILAFIDADVLLTESWADEFLQVERLLFDSPLTITGARYEVGRRPGWIERHWFGPSVVGATSYINSGNLITTKTLHETIGGFSQTLATGEDVDYCQRARAAGAAIIQDVKLRTMHEGYPKTLRGFVRREMWHGQGDVASLRALLRSRVAVCAVLFCLFHLAAVCGMVFRSPAWLGVGLGGILALCLASSIRRSRRSGLRTVLVNCFIYYFYFVGRAISLFVRAAAPQAGRGAEAGRCPP
jgi:glycosyltransferase involved in cell wall biosynthesis